MARFEVILPAMGEGIIEATVTRWFVAEGEHIEEDQSLVEVATDKVDSEIPSPVSGKLISIMAHENDVPLVGDIIAIIETDDDSNGFIAPKSENTSSQQPEIKISPSPAFENHTEVNTPAEEINFESQKGNNPFFLSPFIKSVAQQMGIGVEELSGIKGTGDTGRIVKNDLLSYLSSKISTNKNEAKTPEIHPKAPLNYQVSREQLYQGDFEVVEMDRMRKMIANHMVYSMQIAPHVTSFVEIDVTNLVMWREKNKEAFLHATGEKLTFMPAFFEATAKALEEYPMVNVSIDGSTIIRKKQINIGVATSLPSGNLIVPVIRNTNKLNISGLANQINTLAKKARENKLSPTDTFGGTFTITNMGSFGNLTGTPVINQPQSAILAIGIIQKKPAVVETPDGDTIGIRHIMILSMSYDHRIIDGAAGGLCLKYIGDYLAKWDINRNINS